MDRAEASALAPGRKRPILRVLPALVTILPWLAVATAPGFLLHHVSNPYLGILSLILLAAVATALRHERGRHAALALAATALALLVLEALVTWQTGGFAAPRAPIIDDVRPAPGRRPSYRIEGDYAALWNYFETDWTLGYGPRKGVRVTSRKLFGDDLIYDVVYTVGPDGLRVIPFDAAGAQQSLAFFGDSFTYGEGVNDDQSFPALVQKAVGHAYRVYNFAFHGYGPHQMLRRMDDSDALALMRGTPPQEVFYLAIPEHVFRALYASSWDAGGPRYVLAADGTLHAAGNFSSQLWAWLHRRLMFSHLYAKVASAIIDRRTGDLFAQGLPLFTAIVAEARRIVEDQWHARFHVLTWCRPDEDCKEIERRLREHGVDVTSLRDVLPDFVGRYDRFVFRYDKHPSPYGHERVADYIVRTWLRPAPAAAAQP